MTRENFVDQVRWAFLLPLLAALVAAQLLGIAARTIYRKLDREKDQAPG